jgi:hypothetical protein
MFLLKPTLFYTLSNIDGVSDKVTALIVNMILFTLTILTGLVALVISIKVGNDILLIIAGSIVTVLILILVSEMYNACIDFIDASSQTILFVFNGLVDAYISFFGENHSFLTINKGVVYG